MKNKHSKKNTVGTIVSAFLYFCIIGGGILKYTGNDESSVLLTIYNTYTAVCVIGAYLIILLLIFFCGYPSFINYPQFKKACLTKAKVIYSEKAAKASIPSADLTVEFTDINGSVRQCEIITDNYKAPLILNARAKAEYDINLTETM
ncbi:MAG: hypothetical protein IJ007_00615 [Oscillospiraceae bacterium]|nr:hypothetical protein [Oscillospiraceae bacterium]